MTVSDVVDDINVQHIVNENEGYKILKNVRSSHYFQQKQNELFALIRQLGMPTFFATCSAAETKWKDLLNLLCKKNHNKEVSDDDFDKITYMQKAELIQKDPLTCARHFQYRRHIFSSITFSPHLLLLLAK